MTDIDEALAAIESAFADVVRPGNGELLHADCSDDMDLEALYPIRDWRAMTDEDVVGCYASLSFLSAEGFRYFIPAYMSFVLRHPGSPEAVVSSTVWAFDPTIYDDSLADFVASKHALLDARQREAVRAFLEAMVPFEPDAGRALRYWQSQGSAPA